MKQRKKLLLAQDASVLIGKYEKARVKVPPLRNEYRQAFAALRLQNKHLSVVAGTDGHPRLVSGLAARLPSGNCVKGRRETAVRCLARSFVISKKTRRIFALDGLKLAFAGIFTLPQKKGFKVVYQQMVKAGGRAKSLVPVHGALFEMLVAEVEGGRFEIQKVISTVVRGKASRLAGRFAVDGQEAARVASRALVGKLQKLAGYRPCPRIISVQAQANLVRGKLRPIWRLKLDLGQEGRPFTAEAIVDGQSGRTVFARKLGCRVNDIAARSLVNVASRSEAIIDQVRRVKIDKSLLFKEEGRYILANKWIRVVYNQGRPGGLYDWRPVSTVPGDDTENGGTFIWPEDTPQFKGVVLYWSYMDVIRLLSECGLEIPDGKPLLCYAEHPANIGGATFYPEEWLIQIGVGDGKYMWPHIIYDLVVVNHEYGHVCVYYLRPREHYLPGPLGIALNEAIADMIATLIRLGNGINYALRLSAAGKKAKRSRLDGALTYARFLADIAGIGTYCLGGYGFRYLNNTFKYPGDLAPEHRVHDNARIPGGAMFHTLTAWVQKEVSDAVRSQNMDQEQAFQLVMPRIVRQFLGLLIAAIPILPGNRITFSDFREALEDRDTVLYAGAHHAFIAQGFDQHGIKVEHAQI